MSFFKEGALVSAMNSRLFTGDLTRVFEKHIWMNTLSFSYVSSDVPNVFCAAPWWGKRKCGLFDVLLFFKIIPRLAETTTLFDACHKYRPRWKACTLKTSCYQIMNCNIYPPHNFIKLKEMMKHTKNICNSTVKNTCRGLPMMNSEIQVNSSLSNIHEIQKNIIAVGYINYQNLNKTYVCRVDHYLRNFEINATVWKLDIPNNTRAPYWGYTVQNSSDWTQVFC